jgi:hypothetical protein
VTHSQDPRRLAHDLGEARRRISKLEEIVSALCAAVAKLEERTRPSAERIACGCGDSMCSDCAGATP